MPIGIYPHRKGIIRRRKPPIERFLSKVHFNTETGCWDWTAAKDSDGYGTFQYSHILSDHGHAYKFSYSFFVGQMPKGLQHDHLCRNRGCVNPFHLEPVTCRENLLRGQTSAAANARKTHCIAGHMFSPQNTWVSKQNGSRHCKACLQRRDKERKARNRAALA